jgi:hypothetical protein
VASQVLPPYPAELRPLLLDERHREEVSAVREQSVSSVPRDAKRIDIANPRELDAWASLLSSSPQQVIDAVRQVGAMALVVALHLRIEARAALEA